MKRFMQSFKPREEILKFWRFENTMELSFFLFMATIIHGTINCDKYKSSKVAYVATYI